MKSKTYESKYEDSNAYKSSYNDDYNVQKSSSFDITDSGYVSSRITKTQEINSTNKYRSESPRNTTSSPITSKYLGDHRTDLNRTSSPIYRTASPIGRTASPVGRTASPINRQVFIIYYSMQRKLIYNTKNLICEFVEMQVLYIIQTKLEEIVRQ